MEFAREPDVQLGFIASACIQQPTAGLQSECTQLQLGLFLSGVNARAENVEPGYSEQWDGKVEPQGPIVDTENVSWGSLKAMF